MCGKNKKQKGRGLGSLFWDDFVNRGTLSAPVERLPHLYLQRGSGLGKRHFVCGWNWLARNVPGLNKKHTKWLRGRKKIKRRN